ncbi:MAG TPA: hypothetical protein VF756_02125 [Thermoanaerobaculia bacterium]
MDEDSPLALANELLEETGSLFGGRPEAPVRRLSSVPESREDLLSQIDAPRLGLYRLVRQCLDDLEAAAPWERLYYPPEDPQELLRMVGSLLDIVQGFPKKVALFARELPVIEEPEENELPRDEVEFLFGGIQGMMKHDLKRLSSTLAPFKEPGVAPPDPNEVQQLCELSADLKGKYGSSLMGATASVVAQGIWSGVEIEPLLFPEKAQEFRGTRELVASLQEVVAAIQKLPETMPLAELLGRWGKCLRVDQYALTDLSVLRGRIATLLKPQNRRSLYSGDYHQIRRREILLSEKVAELEAMHRGTWVVSSGLPGEIYAVLGQRLLEAAAILDANILKGLVGEKKVHALRARAGSSGPSGKTPPAKAKPAPGAPDLDALVPLLSEDDLKIFFEMLLSSVLRRASLSIPDRDSEPREPAPATEPAPPPPAPRTKAARSPAAPAKPAPSPAPTSPPRDLGPVLAKIDARLTELQSPGNPHGSAFRMTQRLLAKHGRVPAAMYDSILPFLDEIAKGLVPDLREIVPYRGITPEVVQRLANQCAALRGADPALAGMKQEISLGMERVMRFLEALRGVIPHTPT